MKNWAWILIFLTSLSAFGLRAHLNPQQRLEELIKMSQSGDYKSPLQKQDLFCGGKKVEADSKTSQLEKSKLCQMTSAEYQAIQDFTVEGNFAMNAVLRKTAPGTPDIKAKISNLNSALKKIDPLKALTLRETNMPASEAQKHVVGKIVDYPGFTSSSLNLNYERNMSHTFFMNVKNCKYISALSNITSEQEVLCAPGSRFKVQAYLKKNNHHYYLMEQI